MFRRDLFSSLFRWAHRQGENFATDGFVFVVNELVRREPDVARSFLRWLCFGNEAATALSGDLPQLGTQRRSEEGTPDIFLQTSELFVLIEVKKGSDLHPGQLRQYHDLIARQTAPTKRLILLTAHDATFDRGEAPALWWRWADVEAWLGRKAFSDPVAQFLVGQFLDFLRRQVMTIERVDWEYVEGVKALYRLTTMLGKALEQAGVPPSRNSFAWDSRGHYIKSGQFWTGIYMDRPELLRFQFAGAKPDVAQLKERGWEYLENAYATTLDLSSENTHFFSCIAGSQLKILTDFVSKAHEVGEQCIAAG